LALVIFQVGLAFLSGTNGKSHRQWSSYLCFPSSWNDRQPPPHLAYLLRWGVSLTF
jgi:hypothetical protein